MEGVEEEAYRAFLGKFRRGGRVDPKTSIPQELDRHDPTWKEWDGCWNAIPTAIMTGKSEHRNGIIL